MGSLFAGIKAGTVAGVVYIGGLALFSLLILYIFKADFLAWVTQRLPALCAASPDACFTAVTYDLIPPDAFFGYFVALVFSGVFGAYYDSFPGRSSTPKGEALAAVVGAGIFLLGLNGVYFDDLTLAAEAAFLVLWTLLYGWVIGKLYVKYTRTVQFQSADPNMVRMTVDGRDTTGKTRTYATHSVHRLRAEVTENSSFKEWTVSGGVSVDDSREFETEMEVNGNGMLRAQAVKK